MSQNTTGAKGLELFFLEKSLEIISFLYVDLVLHNFAGFLNETLLLIFSRDMSELIWV